VKSKTLKSVLGKILSEGFLLIMSFGHSVPVFRHQVGSVGYCRSEGVECVRGTKRGGGEI